MSREPELGRKAQNYLVPGCCFGAGMIRAEQNTPGLKPVCAGAGVEPWGSAVRVVQRERRMIRLGGMLGRAAFRGCLAWNGR